jgi:hypothetical protein
LPAAPPIRRLPGPARGVFALVAVLGAATASATGLLPETGELSCLGAAAGECVYRDRHSGLLLDWPTDWPVGRLKLVTETGPPARARQRDALRWVSVEYLPDDPSLPETSLLRVAVLRVADWIAQCERSAAPPAVEVATTREHVAVAATSAANPYPPGTRDADIFDALRPGPADISRIIRFPEP